MRAFAHRLTMALVAFGLLTAAACGDTSTDPVIEVAALLTVAPAPGTLDVAVDANVTVTFDHAIGPGMEDFAALHEGVLTGPIVDGTWALSADRMVLTFDPAQPLKAATTYVIHLGGGMTDDHGNHVNLDQHGLGMGGQWATHTMMTSGGMGMGQNGQMMGQGWAHPTNGSFGMVFSFTTAS